MYYVYQITNIINQKIYVGVHKSNSPNDGYMGSGTAIIRAIKKYGIENFQKEILAEFDDEKDAYDLESQIVTEEFVADDRTYNVRCGGIGGWYHINQVPANARINLKALRKKHLSGELKIGGTRHWTDETWKNVKNHGWTARRNQGKINPNTWLNLSTEQRSARIKKLASSRTGSKNGMHGTHLYIDPTHTGSIPDMVILNSKHRFVNGSQPDGWILLSEWRDLRKNKTKGAYGRSWYNDGVRNHYLLRSDPTIQSLNLNKGRIRP